MFYTPAPPGSRLFLDFTRDQFCGKVLDRSGMCGEPAVLQNMIWTTDGLRGTWSGGNCVVKNNPNIDIVSATPQKPVIFWGSQIGAANPPSWVFAKEYSGAAHCQYGVYIDIRTGFLNFRFRNSDNISVINDIGDKPVPFENDFLWVVFWDGNLFSFYVNEEFYGMIEYEGQLLSSQSDLNIASRVGGGYSTAHMCMCGITVGTSVSELHEWYRKYKTGNLHTSVVATQSETLPDSALDSTIMLKK